MTGALDCVVVGYHEMPFSSYERTARRIGPGWPEYHLFKRDQLEIGDACRPYLDVVSHLVGRAERERGGDGDGLYHLGEVSNLAALYLTNFLRRKGFEASFVSLLPAQQEELVDLLSMGPSVVAITTTFYLTPAPVTEVVDLVQRHSDALVVVGGPLVTNLLAGLDESALAWALRQMGADAYVVEAQGEATLAEVVAAVRRGRPLTSVPNLIVPDGRGWQRTLPRPEDNPLDECSIDWDSFDDREVGQTAQTRTARSCAFACSFCDYPVRAGALALASLETVESELRALDRRGIRNVIFIDDTFNVPVTRFKELCRMMIRNNFGFHWFSYFRCSNARDDETYDLLADSGCGGVFLGIESGDGTVLANMNKRAQLEHYRDGLARLNDRGVPSFASFIAGFPGETEETVTNTISFVNETAPTFWRAEPFWYNPRAPIGSQADAFGLEGHGYRWAHASMDASGACSAVDRMCDEITASTWMPMYMFDFWALPYLLGKGMSLDEVVRLHQVGERMMRAQQPNPTNPAAAAAAVVTAEADLIELCAGLRLEPARFRRAAPTVGAQR
jgi:radical SAM PhpK family P-methyltransferase